MNTYKTFGLAAAAWAALVCTVAGTASAAEGDIWSIRRIAGGDHGTETLSMADNPVTAGQTVKFKFRMLNHDPANNVLTNGGPASATTWDNRWYWKYRGAGGTNEAAAAWISNPPKVGVWVSGRYQWADVESLSLVGDNYDFTDLICSYTAQPGDFGILTLAAGPETAPVEAAADGTGASAYCLKNSNYWGIYDKITSSYLCNFWLTSLQEADVAAYVTWPSDDSPRWVADRDMSQAGIYIRTIDFDDTTFNDSAWRRVAAGGTSSYISNGNAKRPATLSIPGGVATDHTVTLYAWTEDEDIAYMKDGVEYDFGGGVTRHVVHIPIAPADGETKEIPGGVFAKSGAEGQSTTIFLSATPTNIYRAGVLITNFVTRTVLVGQPEPPSIVVKPNGASDWTAVAGSPDVNDPVVPITVGLEGVESYTSDITVTITAEMINSTANPLDFIGLSSNSAGDPNGTSATVTIPAGTQSAFAYVYVKRASEETSASAKGISLKAAVSDSAVETYFSGGIIPGTLHIQGAKPVITSPANDTVYYDVPAGEEYEMSFNVSDAYGELDGNYTLEYTLTGIWSSMNTKTLDLGVPNGSDNTLTTNLIFSTSSSNILMRVKNQDGYTSDPIHITVNVFAKPLIGAVPEDHNGTDGNPSRVYNEGDYAKLKFTLDTPFALADSGYIFLVPQTEESSNLVETTAFEQGIRIVRGQSATERSATLRLLDGSAGGTELRYEFEIWNRPTKTETGAVRIGTGTDGYASGEITLYVDNVMPSVEGVSMSDTPLFTNNGTMEAKAAKDVTKIFRLESVNEPSDVDLDDTNTLFMTEWKFYEGGAVLLSTNVYGNPYTDAAAVPYAFHNSGTNKVTVKVKDKDMTEQQFKQSAGFTFFVETLDEPTISMEPHSGSSFYFQERQVGSLDGRVDVKLNIAPTETVVVQIDVVRDGADDGLTQMPVLNTNLLTFTTGTTSRYFYFKELDGDATFTIRARVITETQSVDPGKTWAQYYHLEEEAGYPMTVINDSPEIQGFSDTNAVPASIGVPTKPIQWTAKDVFPDVRQGMTASWTVEGATIDVPITYTNATGNALGTVGGSYSPTFTSAGEKTVTLTVTDKNGGSSTRRYYFYIEPSKELYLYPMGPRTRAVSLFSSYYVTAAGLGAGRVWAGGGGTPAISGFEQLWTLSSTLDSVNVYGYGYRVSERSNGTLVPGRDFPLDVSGNLVTNNASVTYYQYQDSMYDSFFYCWILDTREENGNFTGAHLGAIQPAVGTDTTDLGSQPVGLPPYEKETVQYERRYVEGVFSREYYSKDNVGDINLDGIPDVYAASVAWSGVADTGTGGGSSAGGETAGSRLFEIAGYTSDSAGDLKDLRSFNGDNDYLPSRTSSGGTLIPGISSDWATYGSPFTAYLELRGYGDGLNYRQNTLTGRGRNTAGKWISEKDFNELEMIAYSNAWVAAGSPGSFENFDWTPENRTDPTIEDTDGDGLPDGYEYYLWYRAYVGYFEYDTVGYTNVYRRLAGSRFRLQDIGEGAPITPDEIAELFNPNSYAGDLSDRDTDNDGLTDLEEFALGTNPIHWDTDGDGISDYWEVIRGLNPLYAEKDTIDSESNPDGDFMAEHVVSSDWGVITFEEDAATGVSPILALRYNGPAAIDADTLTLRTGVTNVDAILVFRYGNSTAPVVPCSRGIWKKTTPSSGYDRYVCSGDGARPLDRQKFDITKLGAVKSVATNQTLVLIHDQVRAQYGFDPRTGWNKNAGGKVSSRWDQTLSAAGTAMDTRPFRNLDEYLLLKYRYMTSGSITGEPPVEPAASVCRVDAISRNLKYDLLNLVRVRSALVTLGALADQLPDQMTLADIFLAGTTNPNIRYSDKTYGEYKSPSSENSGGEGSDGALVQFTSRIHGADTDCDGVPDGWELYVGFDPADRSNRNGEAKTSEDDFDKDNLKLASEYAGTDSCNAYSSAVSVINRENLDASEDTELVATIYENHPGIKKRWFNKFFPTDPWDRDTDGDHIPDNTEGADWQAPLVYNRLKSGDSVAYKHSFIYKFNDTEETTSEGDGGLIKKVVYTANGEEKPVDDGSCCIRGGGLNPCTVDTDFDLLPDPWEREFAGVLFTQKGVPADVPLPDWAILDIRRSDGLLTTTNEIDLAGNYISGGMDGTFGWVIGTTYTGDAYTGSFADERTRTVRDYDFDHDGLQNFQEYLVQALRHLRYDDSETPLMGRWMPGGTLASEKFLGFIQMNVMDGEKFYKDALAAGFVGSSAWNFRELGYFARPPRDWDIGAVRTNMGSEYDMVGFRYMLPPHGLGPSSSARLINFNDWYASTDPRRWDSDNDGMDDYYELFHGLNPLLGSIQDPGSDTAVPAGDVIAAAYAEAVNEAPVSFWNNAWRGWPGKAGAEAAAWLGTEKYELFDAIRYPWMMGAAEADADGDGIRNSDEALIPNMTSPQPMHTDPTPLWLTDSTALNKASFTAQYYQRPKTLDNYMPWAWAFDDGQTSDGENQDFLFSFEENEGYDTDHDWISDSEEQRMTATPETDSLDFSDPDRRQAIWFPGTNSAAVSRTDNMHRLNYASYDFLRQFTVEAWIKPEDISRKQVILERACWYGASTLSNNMAQVRANFLLGIDAEGRLYGLYDTSDAIPSESYDGAAKVLGLELEKDAWTHVAMTFDGAKLDLYMNGTVVASEPTTAIPANGIVTMLPEAYPGMSHFPIVENGYSSVPSAMVLGAKAAGRYAVGVSTNTTWEAYTDFYAGYIDEVRVWDGARSGNGIVTDMKKRYTFADVSALRAEVYAAWAAGATRNDNDGKANLPAELAMHYNFQTIPGADDAKYVAWEPSGFTKNVKMNGRVDGWDVPGDIYCGWWYAAPVRSTVYKQYRVVPWIQNTVAHLPPMDGSTIDSRYWSAFFGGITPSNEVDVAKILFPNSANPYPYYFYTTERYYHKDRLQRMTRMGLPGSNATLTNYLFELRSSFAGFSDLVPLGGAFAKRGADMWDENGPMDAWTSTLRDTNANGIPDWWEKVAVTQYGAVAGFNWDATVTWPDGDGREMSAREAYLRDLQRGMTPTGSSSGTVNDSYVNMADADNDGLPDWWEDLYGIRKQNGLADKDNDGLSNYAEFLISECFSNYGFRRVSPLLSQTFAAELGQVVPDYFLKVGQLYLGEMFADHDFMEDAWEDQFDPDFVSRFMFDAWADPDNDGWSNWAECRADTDPTLQGVSGVDGYTVVKHPVPDITATIRYNGESTLDAPIYVQAYSGTKTDGLPSAVWQIGSSEKQTKYLGMNPNSVVNLTLGSGSVQPGTIIIQLKSSYWIDAEGYVHYLADSTWVDYIHDTLDLSVADGTKGILFFTDINNKVGTVDYVTGKVTIDFTKCQNVYVVGQSGSDITYFPDVSFFTLTWNGVVPNGSREITMILSNPLPGTGSDNDLIWDETEGKHPSRGAVTEGSNTFVAFLDVNGDGTWTPGEPYGMAADVDVGWSGAKFTVELTETSPSLPRFDLRSAVQAQGFDAASILSDRGVLGNGSAFNVSVPEGSAMPAQTYNSVRVRFALNAINGRGAYKANSSSTEVYPNDVVFDQRLNLAANPFLTEKNLLTQGVLDLEWGTLGAQAANLGLNLASVTRATYRIVLGDGLISSAVSNNNLSVAFVNEFEATRTACVPVWPRGTIYSQPTFRWTHENSIGKNYPAFQLRVYSGSTLVYDSGARLAPPRNDDGEYVWTAPIYPDMMTPNGRIFATTNNYSWSVSMLDAKFTTPGTETRANFRLEASGQLGKISDYGMAKVKVRYFGPANVTASAQLSNSIRVQAFTTPDFSGMPAGEGRVTRIDDISSVGEIEPNAVIMGLKPGVYYLRAFIDTDGDGAFSRTWESWGYGNFVGAWDAAIVSVSRGFTAAAASGSAYVYTPRPYTVAVGAEVPVAEIYIEDQDSDNDGFPDAWERSTRANLDVLGPASGATFFTKVNTNLATTVAAFTKLNASSAGKTYAPITLMNALVSGADPAATSAAAWLLSGDADSAAPEVVAVRIDGFSLEAGLTLAISADVPRAEANGLTLFTVSDTADVKVVLVAAKSADFADARETTVKTITIKADATTSETVTAEELRAAIDAAGLSDAAFFKVRLEQ